MSRYLLKLGDCIEAMRQIPDNSVDSVVCDPPYHLTSIVKRFGGANAAPAQFGTDGAFARSAAGFMGQQWDGGDIAFRVELWAEVLRVLKPGGYLLAYSGSRTYHRMACAIEDAGFEVRDRIRFECSAETKYGALFDSLNPEQLGMLLELLNDQLGLGSELAWEYGSGFPKSHDAGDGRGTALKPAHEPICVGRKPLIGTVAENVLEFGTGALNIDACRVAVSDASYAANCSGDRGHESNRVRALDFAMTAGSAHSLGRWPANVIHDGSGEVLAVYPDTAGAAAPVHRRGADKFRNAYGTFAGNFDESGSTFHGDIGGAGRFFYCAKASKRDREEGCEHLPDSVLAMGSGAKTKAANGEIVDEAGGGFNAAHRRKNNHPTVKPTELMRYLCRLVTPPGGVVLDPFMGSGSTGKAAMMEGLRFIGIEREPNYMAIAEARVAFGLKDCESAKPCSAYSEICKPATAKRRRIPKDTGQGQLFEAAA